MKKMSLLFVVAMMSLATMGETKWVDLGLPSGTLWASEPEAGYYTYSEAIEKFGIQVPTKFQWQELIESCSIIDLGEKGMEFQSKNGNSIIIPANGWIFKNGKVQNKEAGYYRTSNVYSDKSAWYVILRCPVAFDIMQWTYKESYKIPVLLVNK